MSLTDTAIRRTKLRPKPFKMYDSGGLFLLVTPNGGKWWRFKYHFAGKEKLLSLGTYPNVSLKDARERRDQERKKLTSRIDPSVNRKALKAAWEDIHANSLEVVAREWIEKRSSIWAISRQALEILTELQPLTGRGTYLFPSPRTNTRPMSDNAVLSALRRMGVSKEEMTGHGFRAMARTVLDEVLHVRPDYIEHQLAHAVRDPNGRAYNRTAHLPERRKMMQDWADYLDELREKS